MLGPLSDLIFTVAICSAVHTLIQFFNKLTTKITGCQALCSEMWKEGYKTKEVSVLRAGEMEGKVPNSESCFPSSHPHTHLLLPGQCRFSTCHGALEADLARE